MTFINAVLSIGMMAELLNGLVAEQTSVCGLSSERKHTTAQILTVTLLTVLQTLQHTDVKQLLQCLLVDNMQGWRWWGGGVALYLIDDFPRS